MSARPELAGVKIRKRKKDIKSKHEPEEFAEQLIQELTSVHQQGIDAVARHLDTLDDKMDYKRYGEILFDVLFTGGMLGAGGEYVDEEGELSPFCVFKADDTVESIKKHAEVFNLLIRRFRYLQKSFEDSISKLLRFINRFSSSEVNKLAMCFSYIFASQLAPFSVLSALFLDHLVKEGLSLQFVTIVFRTYLSENSLEHLSINLKKNGLEDKLLDFFPPNKRTTEFFSRHFTAEGLEDLVKYHTRKLSLRAKEDTRDAIVELIQGGESSQAEVIAYIKQQTLKHDLSESDVVDLVWDALMKAVDWPRKPELCEEACLKQVREWAKVLAATTHNSKGEVTLLKKIQIYCYQDTRVTKSFVKLVQTFYQLDIVTENAIIYWHTKGAVPKGKALFVGQLQPFIKWLSEAEEEDGSDGQEE